MSQSHGPSSLTPIADVDIESLIIPIREYSRISHPIPYRYEISTGERHLVYFGTRHFATAKDPQFDQICQCCDELHPDAVMVEVEQKLHYSQTWEYRQKFLEEFVPMLRTEAVQRGEAYLGIKLAQEHGAYVEHPELDQTEQFLKLGAEGFKKEEIFAYFIYRAISMWSMYRERWTLPELIEYRTNYLRPFWPWPEVDISWHAMKKVGESIWGDSFFDDSDRYKALVSPLIASGDSGFSVINTIAERNTMHADVNIVRRVRETVSGHRRTLVIFGASHAFMQERALRRIL